MKCLLCAEENIKPLTYTIISFSPRHNSVRQILVSCFKDNTIECQGESKRLTQGHTPTNAWNWDYHVYFPNYFKDML